MKHPRDIMVKSIVKQIYLNRIENRKCGRRRISDAARLTKLTETQKAEGQTVQKVQPKGQC